MKRLCYLGYLVCLLSAQAFASTTGSITGTVTDTTGSVIPGAAVTVQNAENGVKTPTTTNATGAYVFPELPVGVITFRLARTAFRVSRKPGSSST